MELQLSGECQKPDVNNGIVKITITIHGGLQPEYAHLNLVRERSIFEDGDEIEMTLKVMRRRT